MYSININVAHVFFNTSQYGPQTATDGGLREALLSSYVFLAISIQMHLEQISLLFGQIGKRYNFSQQAVISRIRISPGSVSHHLQCLRIPRVDSPASECLPIRSLLINPGRIDIILAQPLTKTPGRKYVSQSAWLSVAPWVSRSCFANEVFIRQSG